MFFIIAFGGLVGVAAIAIGLANGSSNDSSGSHKSSSYNKEEEEKKKRKKKSVNVVNVMIIKA